MNIYIGNISLRLKESHVRELFEAFGEVVSVKIIRDFNTGSSKGIGFVEMKYDADGQTAITKLNRCSLDGSVMIVNVAKGSPAKNKYDKDRKRRSS